MSQEQTKACPECGMRYDYHLTECALWSAYAEGRADEREESLLSALLRERVDGYCYARQQAADFVRSAGHPELAASILLNWAPGYLPGECPSCGGSGEREVYVQSMGGAPWDDDGHEETVQCDRCAGTGLDYTTNPSALGDKESA